MGPCPYCGDNIGAEARICKHCSRTVLYSVNLTATLDDRQKHEFLKAWQKEEFRGIKHTIFGSLADSRKQLDKIPLVLAWDLNRFTASMLSKKFEHLGIEIRFQGGMPSTFESQIPERKPSAFLNALYIGVGFGLIVGAIFLWMDRQRQGNQGTQSERAEIFETPSFPSEEIPPIQLSQPAQQKPSAPGFPQELTMERDSIDAILGATVFISGESSLGSGFLITSNGYILSNVHVTKSMATPYVTLKDGRRFDARKIKDDSRYDISLLKIDAHGLPYLRLGDANQVYAGEPVITVGNPGGLAFTVTRGIVSFNGRVLDGVPYIQTDAAINKGNSGGPMINRNLEVIGINTLTSLNEQGISFALPINLACDVNGVTTGLGTSPSSCAPIDAPQQRMDAVSMGSHSKGNPNSAIAPYQQEALEHKERLDASERDVKEQHAELQKRALDIKAQAESDPLNGSLASRLKPDFDDVNSQISKLQRSLVEAKIRYIESMIGLLERQALDSVFQGGRPQIEAQISQLRESRQGLLSRLNIP